MVLEALREDQVHAVGDGTATRVEPLAMEGGTADAVELGKRPAL